MYARFIRENRMIRKMKHWMAMGVDQARCHDLSRQGDGSLRPVLRYIRFKRFYLPIRDRYIEDPIDPL
jgi:hypothetical protein